jgi:CelD/BcsL family acetyltransferase involved in cellulose biosynthesis
MSAWYENFGRQRALMILTARQNGILVGILPMVREDKYVFGRRIGHLSLCGSGVGGADYLDVIARPADKAKCSAAFIEHLANLGADVVEFSALESGSETVQQIKRLCGSRGSSFSRLTEKVDAVCPQIDLSAGWERVLNRSKRKANFARRLKALKRESSFEFRTVTATDQVDAAFERFLRLHEMRWEGSGGSELSGHPRLIEFHRRAVSGLAATALIRFDELWLDGECRASIYGLDNGKTFYYYNSGYDPAFAGFSVGLVLLGMSIRGACERGATTYDFLRGDETYKFDWADRSSELATISLSNRCVPVILRERIESVTAGLRSFAKSALPSGIAEPLQNWRRAARRKYQLSGQ